MKALLGSTATIRSVGQLARLQRRGDDVARRLSTGLAVSAGRDGPARLIAGEVLRNERAAAESAQLGANRARGMVAVVDAALSEVQNHLREVGRLALSSDGASAPAEIDANQRQIDQLVRQIETILSDTRYAGRPIFRGEPVDEPAPLPPGVPLRSFAFRFNSTGTSTNSFDPDMVVTSDAAGFSGTGPDSFLMRSADHAGDATGAGNVSARLADLRRSGGGVADNGWQAGVTIRHFFSDTSPFVTIGYEQGVGIVMQHREGFSTPATKSVGPDLGDNIHLRLQRTGSSVSPEYSTDGVTWVQAFPPVTFTAPFPATPQYGIYAHAAGTGNGFVEADYRDVQVRPGTLPLEGGVGGRPDPEAGVLAGDPAEGVSQTAFTFSVGTSLPKSLAALRFETTQAADLGGAGGSLLDLTSGGALALTSAGPTEAAQDILNAAASRIGEMRAHAGRFEQVVVDPAAAAAGEMALQVASAQSDLWDADFAENIAARSRLDALEFSARRAMQIIFDVSRQQVDALI
ncbi:MAG: hypothetical protein AAGK78_06220 [Planctomycetota bacterium]